MKVSNPVGLLRSVPVLADQELPGHACVFCMGLADNEANPEKTRDGLPVEGYYVVDIDVPRQQVETVDSLMAWTYPVGLLDGGGTKHSSKGKSKQGLTARGMATFDLTLGAIAATTDVNGEIDANDLLVPSEDEPGKLQRYNGGKVLEGSDANGRLVEIGDASVRPAFFRPTQSFRDDLWHVVPVLQLEWMCQTVRTSYKNQATVVRVGELSSSATVRGPVDNGELEADEHTITMYNQYGRIPANRNVLVRNVQGLFIPIAAEC